MNGVWFRKVHRDSAARGCRWLIVIYMIVIVGLTVRLTEAFANAPSGAAEPAIWQCIGCSPETFGTKMSRDQQARQLNDMWGKEVLRKNIFPVDVKAATDVIAKAGPHLTKKVYLVAEGGQIPVTIAPRDAQRDPRMVITWVAAGSQVPTLEVLLSANPGEQAGFLQLIAWDPQKKRFNFYERLDSKGHWSWAGDSSQARDPQVAGKGCFDCHHNGVVIMKELERPWNNWQSELARIDLSVLPAPVEQDPNLRQMIGANIMEQDIKIGLAQYYTAWLDGHLSDDLKTVTGVSALLRHLITTTTVNLESNLENLGALGQAVVPPKNFFLFDDILSTITGDGFDPGYKFPATIRFNTNAFLQDLTTKGFALRQCNRIPETNRCRPQAIQYEQQGTTFHPFFVPTPSHEDKIVINNLVNFQVTRQNQRKNIQFISQKFAAAVLMVDFQNPVFSPVRSRLQAYAEKINHAALDASGVSNIPELFAAAVQTGAAGQPACDAANLDACTAEQQFLHTWHLPDSAWKAAVSQRLQAYLDAVALRLQTGSGLSDYVNLAISRRGQFAALKPIRSLFESSLLFPQSDLPADAPVLRMHVDGTVRPTSS